MSGKPDATETYTRRRSDIARLLDVLRMELDAHGDKARVSKHPWAYAGDLEKVRADLMELVGFIAGMEREQVEEFLAEDEAGGRGAGKDETVAGIARSVLGVETLEPRNHDALDLHDVSVLGIKQALGRAGRPAADPALSGVPAPDRHHQSTLKPALRGLRC